MKALEFEAEVENNTLRIPDNFSNIIPSHLKAKIIILFEDDVEENEWRRNSYQQFLKDDSTEDAIYERSR